MANSRFSPGAPLLNNPAIKEAVAPVMTGILSEPTTPPIYGGATVTSATPTPAANPGVLTTPTATPTAPTMPTAPTTFSPEAMTAYMQDMVTYTKDKKAWDASQSAAPTVGEATTPAGSYAPSPYASQNLTGILSEGSPLMEQAETQGKQYANQRGLLNTSLGAEAAQSAMVEAATPLAQADAQFASSQALQDDALAVRIMESDMPSTMKDSALDYLLGEGSRPAVSEATPAEQFGDYKTVKANFPDFASFVGDSEGRNVWKTEPDAKWETIAKDMGDKKKSYVLGTDWTNTSKSKAQKIQATYGSWENAMRAVRTYAGPNVSDAEAKQIIMDSLK